jgi:glycosyltransferase involved in cell wall biosynthesis
MMKQFKIVVPSFNSTEYLPITLQSIQDQTYKNYQVCIIDDGSTLPLQREIIEKFAKRNKWKTRFHDKNKGAMYGIVHAIRDLECEDDDVIVILDGDDWLAHEHVLEKLHKLYSEKDIYLTWGQCEIYPATDPPTKFAHPVPDLVIDQKLYRSIRFVFWHLRTFKFYLWRHVQDQDLRDETGEYLAIMSDKAYLFPLLEMAGHKIHFIPETLYIYNIENPLNDYANTPHEEHERVDHLIRNRPKYQLLDLNR